MINGFTMNVRRRQFIPIREISALNVSPSLVLFLGTSLVLHLSHIEALAGPAKSSGQAAPAPAAATAQKAVAAQPSTAAPQQLPLVAKQPVGNANAGVATNIVVPVDLGHAVLGGSVFSTGSEDILLKVLTPSGLPYPDEAVTTVISGQRVRLPNPNVSAYTDDICIVSPGPARMLASNRQYDRTINLGKLPAGEVIFAIRTPDGNFFKTGDGSRNGDRLPHAMVKTFVSGAIQLWFEDQAGSRLPGSDRDFNDAVFELSGGVADNNAVADLTKIIKEQQGQARQEAFEALKRINPKAALSLAVAQR
jgi:hypothetical protein